jgi:uncharacterized protein YndB with AHSA1/START domain
VIQRAVVIPAGPDEVWHAITDPAVLDEWFGAEVRWDLSPGGPARFAGTGGSGDRAGVVDDVTPGRRLSFRWWPTNDDSDVSEVAYELRPDEEGTELTVTERRIDAPAGDPAEAAPATGAGASARAARPAGPSASAEAGRRAATDAPPALDGCPATVGAPLTGGGWGPADEVALAQWVATGLVAVCAASH